MSGKRFQWAAEFEICQLSNGRRWTVRNAILAEGIELTLALWAGDTDEFFERFRFEDSGGGTIHEAELDLTFDLDTSGSSPLGLLTSRALVAGDKLTSPTATIAVIGSLGTEVARAAVALDADQAYEIKRIDYLAESADVLP